MSVTVTSRVSAASLNHHRVDGLQYKTTADIKGLYVCCLNATVCVFFRVIYLRATVMVLSRCVCLMFSRPADRHINGDSWNPVVSLRGSVPPGRGTSLLAICSASQPNVRNEPRKEQQHVILMN